MTTTSIVLLVLGILTLIESSILLFFPKEVKSITKIMLKTTKNIRKVGIVELIIAVILLVISLYIL